MLFKDASDSFSKVSYHLLQNGCMVLFWKKKILKKYILDLQSEDFSVVEFDCRQWKGEIDFFNDVSKKLSFPDYFGNDLDAFNDSLSDIEIQGKGIVLVFNRYDIFNDNYPEMAKTILDIIHINAWRFLLFGKGCITFIQSDNPKIEFDNIGRMAAEWNSDEWLNSSRGL